MIWGPTRLDHGLEPEGGSSRLGAIGKEGNLSDEGEELREGGRRGSDPTPSVGI